ncbi:hypothetical protein H7I41_09140 [Mycobacterium manitobense]|uniref:PH domain-containing protein n=1 Tax=[Mycobacterium] manitobense TaxID=190147 RepID=A0A9X3BM55_9MYCO|nr:hypothetical protein [[Mycobacterium] manitobense]MCV7170084.1 hypothetical protein [[Mycobacterium] manitobense]
MSHPSPERPDLPDGWADTTGGVRERLAIAGTLTIAAASTATAVAAALGGNVVAARYCLLFALAMALVAALGAAIGFRRVELPAALRTLGERGGVPATEIRCSGAQFALLVSVTACCAAFCLMAAVEVFVRHGGPAAATALLAAGGLFFGSFGAAAAFGRIRRGGVTLSGRGIAHRGWSFESRLEWPAIAGITPAFNGHPTILVIGYTNADWDRRYTTRLWRIDRLPPVPMIEVDCRRFDLDPHALYGYLAAYVESADARSELGTEAALTRARNVR